MVFFLKEKIHYALGLAFFFALLHYKGFDKDAAIYLLQVMNYLQPERFVNDVPFMFGNQDSFSFFSPVIATVFKLFGVNVGGMVGTFFLLFFLCVSLIALVSKWNDLFGVKKWTLPIVLIMFALLVGKNYGSGSLYIPLFEPYLVARVLSEIFIVVGLIYLFNKNQYVSLVFFVVASCVHPLMGGWGILLWVFFHYSKIRLPIMMLAMLAPLSGFMHVGRFDFYPDDWKPLYLKPCLDEFAVYAGLLTFWLAMYRHFKKDAVSKFAISMFGISLIGFYLQFTGSYIEHIFLYQVQPFRVQWLCTISVLPILVFFVCDNIKKEKDFSIRDIAGFVLGLLTVSGGQWIAMCRGVSYLWLVLLAVSLLLIYTPTGNRNMFMTSRFGVNVMFVIFLVFLIFESAVCNYIQLAIEQSVGYVGLAVSWVDSQDYLMLARMFLLFTAALLCVAQKRLWLALLFAFSFCNATVKVLPIVGLFLYVLPNLRPLIKKSMLAFSVPVSFFEISNSLYRFNSTEKLPLEGNPLVCVLFFIVLFGVAMCFLNLRGTLKTKKFFIPLVILIISFFVWDFYRWDARNETVILNECQMDAFFERPIFPQVKDRGKILFVVDYEAPVQSRINFMTGAYADASIYVGEIFFRDQYLESNRRRNALLTGSLQIGKMNEFKTQIMNVYQNTDTLLARVNYLCGLGDITHLATDYAQMPLFLQDSIFLDKKNKNVYLYGCKK